MHAFCIVLAATICETSFAARDKAVYIADVVRPTPANPRHDHQLIFPLLDGRLLLVWSEYYVDRPATPNPTARDDMPCRIAAMISTDRGRTWHGKAVLQPNIGKFNVKHPNLLRLPSGEILFFFTQWNSRTERIVLLRRSRDDGRTWSPPARVSSLRGINNINNDHVLQLSSGRIILPAFQSESVWDKTDHWRAFCYYSDDAGTTWQASSKRIDLPKRGAEEPAIVETADGALAAFLRTSLGRVYRAESHDAGATWSEAVATPLVAPASPPLVKRFPRGNKLLAVWNRNFDPNHHHGGARMPLSTALSADEGKSWTHIRDLEETPGGGAAYAAVFFQHDEALVTYYFQPMGFGGASGIRLKIVPLDWFEASNR